MNRYYFSIISAALIILLAPSCQNEGLLETYYTSEDVSSFQDLVSDVEDYLDDNTTLFTSEQTTSTRSGCATFEYENEPGTFPNTLTITFDGNCTGYNDRVRSGQIIISQSDVITNPQAVRIASLVDFSVDQVLFEGSKTLTNISSSASDGLTFERIISDGKISFPSGQSVSLEGAHILTQTAGTETDERHDDVYAITGSSSGVNRIGNAFEATIVDALVKSRNCRWIRAGVISIDVNESLRSVDYGDGDCDNKAVVTLPNGNTRDIRIFRRFW